MKTELKASELRIGNYYLDKNNKERKIICVSWLGVYSINNHYLSDCKPIQLTEEWLIKMGLTYHEQDEAYFNNVFYIEERNTDKYLSKANKDRLKDCFGVWLNHVDTGNFLRDVKYLHELQNLYHALTGEELTIKND